MKGKMKGHFRKGKKGTVHELEFIPYVLLAYLEIWQLITPHFPPIYGGEAFGGPTPIGVTAPQCPAAWPCDGLWLWSTCLAVFGAGTPAPALFFLI